MKMQEGAGCIIKGCTGVLIWARDGDCCCHIFAPCNSCSNPILECDQCGEVYDEEDE